MNKEKIYVLGHKNPDTDSFCAAATYARLKQRLGEEHVVAGRLGEATAETAWVFDYWKVEHPEFVADVKLRAKDIMNKNFLFVSEDESLKQVGEKILATKSNNAYVCCPDRKVKGIITLGDLGVFCLQKVIEKEKNETVDAAIILEQPVSALMKTELIGINSEVLLDEVKSIVLKHRFRSFPVVNQENQLVGIMTRKDLISAKPKQVILVDHNEKSQAVTGIEGADVVEVIDHHRIADVQTMAPIFFLVEPVGCTCTIVANLYKMHGLQPEPAYAGLMLSAIISDTLLFRSPTSTGEDEKAAKELAQICSVDLQAYGMELLSSSSLLMTSTAEEVLMTDLKEFSFKNLHLMIGQVLMSDNDSFIKRKQELLEEMRKMLNNKELDLIGLMCTNILEETTYLLVIGDLGIAEQAFGKAVKDNEIYLPGVLSRKKQIVPLITKALS